MITLRYIVDKLTPFLLRTVPAVAGQLCPERMELLGGQTSLRADRLYLGTMESARLLPNLAAQPGTVILLAGNGEDPTPPSWPEGCVLVSVLCSLPHLFNTVSQATAAVSEWRQSYTDLADRGKGLHAMVELTGRLAGAAVLLLDAGNRVVASGGMEHSRYLAAQVAAAGALPRITFEALFPDGGRARNASWAVPETGLILYAQKLVDQDRLLGSLVLEGRREQQEIDCFALCQCACSYLRKWLLSPGLERLGYSTKAFQQCWEAIAGRQLISPEEIRLALSKMPYPIGHFVQLGVVMFFGDGGVPYNYIVARLREIFPEVNMAVYNRDIVLLLTYEKRTFHWPVPMREQLEELLSRFNACFSIGNGTRNLGALAFLYSLTRQAGVLSRQLDGERIVFYEKYSMYCAIELCVQRFQRIHSSDDIIYLIHPAIVHLTRYDHLHHNNLRDVLYYYLLNDRNVGKTAACTYMHRNTVLNKVNKITEMVNLDLEDGGLRQRLMFSCQLIRYYEQVMHLELKL